MKHSRLLGLAVPTAGVALVLLFCGTGCKTTRLTTLEENRAMYSDARAFLDVGRTTNTDVLRKYGEPRETQRLGELSAPADLPREAAAHPDGMLWRYLWTDTVLIDAFSDAPVGSGGPVFTRQPGFQTSVTRTTRMDLYFSAEGTLVFYRLWRDAP